MDRVQLLLIGLPLFLFCSDILNLFSPPPPSKPLPAKPIHQHPPIQQTLDLPIQQSIGGGVGYGNTITINFCSSCSYRGNAVTMSKMLETSFPGIEVILENYPAPLPKRLLSKVVPVFQVGVMGIVMAGEQIFPRLGFVTPPAFYFTMRQNRFGTIATAWLLGNALQSFLQSSGAFEVILNDELIFSKLKEKRFPSEFELKDIVGKRLSNSRIVDGRGAGVLWS
ncbi:hypothetical protein MKW94_022273 [Papaver nudicaule]|uniref:SelT-like protein n=1 Tax=Papaver nudicaule TaxID=74823 RepID=A0AA41RWR1_PAPNU|nr:hypothetical protein [Papaver nudicaule]MCL7037478.1 hypothetical protein [Papaver nudicaule]